VRALGALPEGVLVASRAFNDLTATTGTRPADIELYDNSLHADVTAVNGIVSAAVRLVHMLPSVFLARALVAVRHVHILPSVFLIRALVAIRRQVRAPGGRGDGNAVRCTPNGNHNG